MWIHSLFQINCTMSKDVIVLAPNGRRQTVKCSLNTTILQILEEVCTKQDFDPSHYELKHHNKVLDLTNSVRFSNLPNKATLEMVERDRPRQDNQPVIIALQLESGERPMAEFDPGTCLYDVLGKLAHTELASCQHPTIVYMRREVFGDAGLRQTTLKHLGLTGGRAVLRLIDKSPEELKTQANVSSALPSRTSQVEQPSPSINRDSQPSTSQPINTNKDYDKPTTTSQQSQPSPGTTYTNINKQNPSVNPIKLIKEEMKKAFNVNAIDENEELEANEETLTESGNVEMREQSAVSLAGESRIEEKKHFSQEDEEQLQRRLNIEQEVTFLGEKKAIAFVQSSSDPELPDLPDEFYDLSVEEVRKLYQELRQQTTATVDAPLLTNQLRQAHQQQGTEKQRVHQYAVVRVQFPDRMILQGVFEPGDTVQQLYQFTQLYLNQPQRPFHLFTTPTRETVEPSMSLSEARFVPGVLLHFRWADAGDAGPPFLKEHVYRETTSTEAAAMLASKYRTPVRRQLETGTQASRQRGAASASTSSGSGSSKLPAWFKMK